MKLKMLSLSFMLVFGLCIGIGSIETSSTTMSQAVVQSNTHGVGG
ncbi:hypothetical protein ACFYU8_18710 [Brevibacillus sp. NPDC003359]